MEKQHEQDKIDMDNLRDVISIDADKLCNSNSNSGSAAMPPKATNQSGIRCYTDAELQRKIKASLVIAGEADLMFEKYVALLKACKVGNK